jgi:hypothetical protein
MLVGLGIDAQLGQDGLDGGGVGGDEVLARDVAILAAAGRLAVEADVQPGAVAEAGGDPTRQGGLEGNDVEAAEELGEAGLGGGLAASEAEGEGQGGALVTAELGDGGVTLGASEHGEDGQGEDGREGVADTFAVTRVGDLGKDFEQAERGRHDKALLHRRPAPFILCAP